MKKYKSYLLVVFGDFNSKSIIEKFSKGMAQIVDSTHLKFLHRNGSMMFHFGSDVSQEEIFDYLTGLFYGFTETFILTEMTDKVSVCMLDESRSHLMDLENDGDYADITIDVNKENKNDLEEMAEGFVEFLLDEFKQEVKVPTLNEILDKINEKGIKSLSTFEKEILDNYSKN